MDKILTDKTKLDPHKFSIKRLTSEEILQNNGYLKELIRKNLEGYADQGGVIAAAFRRLDNFETIYKIPGSHLILLLTPGQRIIGSAGLGPLAGLPISEGVAEVRDLVVDQEFRGMGLGAKLLREILQIASQTGYSRIYLETTPQMLQARKLFQTFGFVPLQINQHQSKNPFAIKKNTATNIEDSSYPAYFVLEDLHQIKMIS